MKTNKCFSPIKENVAMQSDCSPPKSQRSQNDTIRQLLNVMNTKGISIPAHIQKRLKPSQLGLLKLKSTMSCGPSAQDQLKKLKIKMNDIQFQKKQVEQDFAQFKLQSRQQKQKQTKKYEQIINNLKQSLQNTSENSSYKLQILKASSAKQLSDVKTKYQNLIKQEKENLISTYQNRIQKITMVQQRAMKQQLQLYEKKLENQKITSSRKIEEIEDKHSADVKSLQQRHRTNIENKQKILEGRITAAISQKKTEQKLHEKTKLQSNQIKQKLYNQLYYQKKAKNELQDELEGKCKDIRELKRKVQDLELTIKINSDKYQKKVCQMKERFDEELTGLNEEHQEKISQLKKYQKVELQNYEVRLQEMSIIHNQREKVWNSQMKVMSLKFQDRPSKKEDVETIQKLKGKIMRKEDEIKHMNKELKHCLLELENKEDTYNRIFSSATKHDKVTPLEQKKSLNKEERVSRENLFRKSQTTDFKFLLKVYNKQF